MIPGFLRSMSYASIVTVAVFSSGCTVFDQVKADFGQLKTDVKTAISSDSASNTAPRTVAQTALNEGIDLYDKGDFNGAIKRLSNASEIWTSTKGIQTQALKYMAFSYCVTSRQTLCRQQFEKALKLDPHFDLAPGEKGHPLWGSVFERAKKAS